jgi:hypothetical protein
MLRQRFLFLILLVCLAFTAQAQPFTVWPGDANNNGIANHVDLLQIGVSWDSLGPTRAATTIAWAPQLLSTAWGTSALVNVDRGYSDCNGNGLVEATDIFAIHQNFGLFWTPTEPTDSGTIVTTPAPQLRLSIPATAFISGLDTIDLDVLLTDGAANVNDLFGLAFTIEYDPTIIDTVLPTFNGGWLNFDGQSEIVQHVDTGLGRISVAITRRAMPGVSGTGSLGSLGIVMDDDIRINAFYQLDFKITFATANYRNGDPLYLGVLGDTLTIETPLAATQPQPPRVQVFPSPARHMLYLQANGVEDADLIVRDLQGKLVHQAHYATMGRHALSVAGWAAGIYILEIRNPAGHCRAKVCVGAPE